MKKQLLFLTAFFVFLISINAYAATDFYSYADYDIKSRRITVSGNKDNSAGEQVSIMIYPHSADLAGIEELGSAADKDIFFELARFDENNSFHCEISLSENVEAQCFDVAAFDGSEKNVMTVFFADFKTADNISKEIKGKNAQQIKEILLNNKTLLGTECDDFEKYIDKISETVFKKCSFGGCDAAELYKEIAAGIALGKTAEDSAALETVLKRYHAYLNVSYNGKYGIYSDDIKNETARLLTNGDYSGKSFESFYNDCLLLARINKAENEISAKNIMLAEMSELDLSYYGKLNNSYNENSVFKELCQKGPYNSRKELAEAFSKVSKDKYEEINSSSDTQKPGGSGGAGGGGGRGGSSGGGLAGAVYETEENVKDNKDENSYAGFADTDGHWAKDIIAYLAKENIINGFEDNTFRPDNKVTRAEYAKLLCTLFKIEKLEYKDIFSDVGENDWFFGYVLSLADKGIILGFDGKFMPDEPISRQDAAVIIERMMSYKGYKMLGSAEFEDMDEVSDYAKNSVSVLGGAKIIKGYENRFEPLKNATRAEAAAILFNILENYI